MEQPELLRFTVETLERLQIPYLVVGSFASSIWGEPRFTNDIDILIELGLGQIATLCRAFPFPEFYVSEQAAAEAVRDQRQFNVLHPSSGNKIDFMIPRSDDWSQMQLKRGRTGHVDGELFLQVSSPEDVIISKMRYFQEGGSSKHLRDIAGVLHVQRELVDRKYIARWVESMQLQDVWQRVLAEPKPM